MEEMECVCVCVRQHGDFFIYMHPHAHSRNICTTHRSWASPDCIYANIFTLCFVFDFSIVYLLKYKEMDFRLNSLHSNIYMAAGYFPRCPFSPPGLVRPFSSFVDSSYGSIVFVLVVVVVGFSLCAFAVDIFNVAIIGCNSATSHSFPIELAKRSFHLLGVFVRHIYMLK